MGQQGAVWTRTAKDRERWRTLAEGYFLQWRGTAWNRIEQNRRYCDAGSRLGFYISTSVAFGIDIVTT